MARTLIDISAPLENAVPADPLPYRPKITYVDHQASVAQLLSIFPGLTKEELPDGEGWAIENVELITHNGTHLDAPYHFASTMNLGERAITIDEVPLEWFYKRGCQGKTLLGSQGSVEFSDIQLPLLSWVFFEPWLRRGNAVHVS